MTVAVEMEAHSLPSTIGSKHGALGTVAPIVMATRRLRTMGWLIISTLAATLTRMPSRTAITSGRVQLAMPIPSDIVTVLAQLTRRPSS